MSTISRQAGLLILLACQFSSADLSCKLLAATELEAAHPAQWRLVWDGDSSNSARLCWNTTVAGELHQVHLRREGDAEETVVAAQNNGKYSSKQLELYYHHAAFTDLEPATKYHLRIESDGQVSPKMYFTTAPAKDRPIGLLFGSDSRSGWEARREVNAMVARMVEESYQADRVPILALAHGGDFVANGRSLEDWAQWMSDHQETFGKDGRLLPIIPTRGNHDGGRIFNEVFGFPEKHENYYNVDLGPQVRLVTLNTEISVAGDQREWLAETLAASRLEKRWLIVQYHRPAFPAVKVPWVNLVHWVPLFEEHNVDLVCEGDGHNIKRTPPIRNFNFDPSGVVYIGEGGLGVGQRTPKKSRWYLQPPAKTGQGHHVQLLTFDQEKISYRVIKLGGEVFDEHHLPVRKALAAVP